MNINANYFTKKDWASPTEEDIDNRNQFLVKTAKSYKRKCKKCTTCGKTTTTTTAAPETTAAPVQTTCGPVADDS